LGEPSAAGWRAFGAGSGAGEKPQTESQAAATSLGDELEPLSVVLTLKRDTKTWEVTLLGAGHDANQPLWNHSGPYKNDQRVIYKQVAADMAACGDEIAKALQDAGFEKRAHDSNAANVPNPAIETQLAEMNFVSQFAAVRAAHQAMHERGPSLAWMSVLVRGYAHLAMLNDHLWSSQREAFAARSLAYASQMAIADSNSALARWRSLALTARPSTSWTI
jgi:hypothetical protein